MCLPKKICVVNAIRYSLNDAGGYSLHSRVMKMIVMIATNTEAMEGETTFLSMSLLTNQFESIWLPIKDADSRKVMSQNISFNESSLYPSYRK